MSLLAALGLPPRDVGAAATSSTAKVTSSGAPSAVKAPIGHGRQLTQAGDDVVASAVAGRQENDVDGGGAGMPAGGAAAGAAGAPPGPVDKNLAAYTSARDAIQKLIDALGTHPQAAHVAANVASANAKIAAADTSASGKDYTKAATVLGEAKTIAVAAKKLADEWAAYAKALGDAMAITMAFSSSDHDTTADYVKVFADASKLANATPPNFAAAIQTLKTGVVDSLEPSVKSWIADAKATLALIAKTPASAQAFVKAQVDEGKTCIAEAEARAKVRDWSVSVQNSSAALRVLGPAARVSERRGLFDQQRARTVAAVDKARAIADLKPQTDALDLRVKDADALAGPGSLKIETATALLVSTAAQATTLAGLGPTIANHAKDRAAADAGLAVLDKHAAAAKITAQREAIRRQLVQVKALSDIASAAADPVAAWAVVTTDLARARADLAAATTLAGGLGAASAAQAAAANPADLEALKAALKKLQADGAVAAKAPFAAEAATELKTFGTQAQAATAALTSSDGATAATALAAAATALTAAKTIQSGHAQFAALLPGLESQLKALKQSPRAPLIKGRIDPVADGVTTAKAKDLAHASQEALAALRTAADAVRAAQLADGERANYDKRAADLDKRVVKVADASEKTALTALEAEARKDADALTFDGAKTKLDDIEVRLDNGQATTMLKAAHPDAAGLKALAAKMVGKGGAAAVDKLIHDIPDGSDPAAMAALAQGRFGVKFVIGKALPAKAAVGPHPAVPAGDSVKAMREVCDMFAKIPQDIVKSPSVKGIEYKDALGKNDTKTAGGSFSDDDAKIRMTGRPGIPQNFGAAQVARDPKTKALVPQLPPDVEEDCKPKDATPVEFLNFAAAHEVGHSVDDAKGFMARNGALEKFGGWTTYGASVQPIADAIGADVRFSDFYKTPEQRLYVLDKLQNKPAVAPVETSGSPADLARKAFDIWYATATSANVFRRQGDCADIRIGDYVYHEAYVRQWVRYLFAARQKALTGYQFRAPGEWFAELYAGYRSGKLKDTHPAMEWLTTL